MSEMSGFGNTNVRKFALFVPIIALKSYCWAGMPNLQTPSPSKDTQSFSVGTVRKVDGSSASERRLECICDVM